MIVCRNSDIVVTGRIRRKIPDKRPHTDTVIAIHHPHRRRIDRPAVENRAPRRGIEHPMLRYLVERTAATALPAAGFAAVKHPAIAVAQDIFNPTARNEQQQRVARRHRTAVEQAVTLTFLPQHTPRKLVLLMQKRLHPATCREARPEGRNKNSKYRLIYNSFRFLDSDALSPRKPIPHRTTEGGVSRPPSRANSSTERI